MRISDWSSDVCSSDLSADYAALAAHLNPDDPGDGARQIDATIIAYQRARCRPGNHGQLVRHLGMLLMLIAETIAVFHGMLWLEPTALAPYLGFILEVPLWTAAPVAAIAIRSDERRVGKECVSPFRPRWSRL